MGNGVAKTISWIISVSDSVSDVWECSEVETEEKSSANVLLDWKCNDEG